MEIEFAQAVANILAENDINVVIEHKQTASWCPETRTLSLPQYSEELPKAVTDTFLLHECAHVRKTTTKYFDNIKRMMQEVGCNHGTASAYMNVLEDVRIERIIKTVYRQAAVIMRQGYEDLVNSSFFEPGDTDDLCLIDRINLYYKFGHVIKVPFTPVQKDWRDKAHKTVTEEDVYQLALSVYNFDKTWKPDEEENEEEKSSEGRESKRKPGSVQKAIDESVTDHIDHETKSFIITMMPNELPVTLNNRHTSPRSKVNKTLVSHMIQRFEQMQAANTYRKTSISSRGDINTRKLYKYRTSPDIFKQIQVEHDGQNHGIIMVLDCSYSMASVMESAVNQMANVVAFCKHLNIPHKIYAFTSTNRVGAASSVNYHTSVQTVQMTPAGILRLGSENKRNPNYINSIIKNISDMSYNTTPLNSTLCTVADDIVDFKVSNNLQKTTLLLLTDGADDGKLQTKAGGFDKTTEKPVRYKHYLHDSFTKNNYYFDVGTNTYQSLTHAFLRMIKGRVNCNIQWFYNIATNGIKVDYDVTGIVNLAADTVSNQRVLFSNSNLEFEFETVNKLTLISSDSLMKDERLLMQSFIDVMA